jgi:hypothetical protein
MVIRYLKDDIIIKAKEKKLKNHIADVDTLSYPFALIKGDINDNYMMCNSNSCFGDEKNFDGVKRVMKER